MELPMTHELTLDLIEVLNKHYPKLDCGYSSIEDETKVKATLDIVDILNKSNLDIMYPERYEYYKK
jgi:hypothetical protein